MSISVLHVLDHSIPLHSGYTFRTLAILREQRRRGWLTHHLTSPKHKGAAQPVEEVDGWRFHRTLTEGTGSALPGLAEFQLMKRLERRLAEVVAETRPTLLHAHSPVLNALPALRVGRRMGIPVVYEVRAFWEDAAVDHGTTSEGSLRYRLTRGLETQALRGAAHVFTICEGLRQDIAARGIPASKITVIPNAVDIESFAAGGGADEELQSSLGLRGCTVLGFIGSFYAYEGLDLLVAALPELLRRRSDVRVLLIGGGPMESALREQAKSLGVDKQVVMPGRVPHEQVQRYYDLVDVLVYPRRRMRLTDLVTPLKPLEAMAQGRLIAASDVGGHRELIHDGETGVLFQADSVASLVRSLDSLLADRARWPHFRAAGRRFVEQERNWTNSVARYDGVYRRLTQQHADATV